ncbi:hypothetical protein [Croceiramulus getboli]|nr:hypothetical protein P8624_03185 [Flavobacteriaceae bacterium YJPT1-3]
MSKHVKYVLLLILLIVAFAKADAQCAMCRAVLESEADNAQAKGINNGIMYLMALPYILVGGLIYVIYRARKRQKDA